MITFTREPPDWAYVSDWTKERAEGYIEIQHVGRSYYIPLTKEMKRIFGIVRREDKLMFKTMASEQDTERFLRDMVGGLVSQVSHSVGDEVHSRLSQQLSTFLTDALEPHFDKVIHEEMDKKLLKGGSDASS